MFLIRAEWGEEAAVWVATSDDVPRLATEAATMEALSDKLGDLVPELLALNGYAAIWCSPITKLHFMVDSKIRSRHTADAVLKQGVLPKQF